VRRNFHDVVQGGDEWFNLKTGLISSTDCKTLFSFKTSDGYKDLINRLSYERLFNMPIEKKFFGNGWTQRGLDGEADATEGYETLTYRECSNGGFYTLGDHVEAILQKPELFEKELFHQVQFQIYVCGFDFVDQYLHHEAPYKNLIFTAKPDFEFQEKLNTEIEFVKMAVESEIKKKIKLTTLNKGE